MNEIKEKLLQMQKEIIAEIENERDQSASAITDDIGDSIDHATEERSRELYQLLSERDQHKLDQINNALDKIENGEYGECEGCGKRIGQKRLMALPFTELCIECKSEEERTKGQDRHADYSGIPSGIPDIEDI